LRRENPVSGFTLAESEGVHFSLLIHSVVMEVFLTGFGKIRTVVAATGFFSG
jgi:hypothetical protein